MKSMISHPFDMRLDACLKYNEP